ncbi:hypothetical protein [Bradyrhizobium diazoefficiens]
MVLTNLQKKTSQTVFSESEYAILEKTMRREGDRCLRDRINDAMDKFDAVRYHSKSDNIFERPDFEDRRVSITPLEHLMETRWGLHFKDTDEYAIYSVFYGDDSRVFRSYYRSDNAFNVEEPLHP